MAKQKHDNGYRKRRRAKATQASQRPDTDAMARALVRAGICSRAILGQG